ncbi:alpha/beta hydrolase [Pseudoalteromonas sp. SG44-8]|uniref:alpha/beta hydrolase n=1 Tax=Pseudoalteromonas sp. SG44-8 TaxID=2760958 RepID=UPI00160047A6|nr:alpha/beta fold hydrolase [Pseudoalteromonas sp. SG44-8]MBB1398500.1 alpha/beta hydrolase [Pseudoalteromonas sp. SG44-8]
MKALCLNLLLSMTLLILTACTTIEVKESHFIKPDQGIDLTTLQNINNTANLNPIEITAFDGIKLRGTLITVANAKATIVYFGGNQFRVDIAAKQPLEALLPLQTNIVMFDHRGYGKSDGSPTVSNLKQDALSIFDYVKQNPRINNKPIILHGHSLGSVIAGYVTTKRNIDGLVLEGSITNVQEMTDTRVPWYAKPFITINYSDGLLEFDNLKIVKQYKSPLLIITGENDTQTPISLAKSLFKHAASSQKQLYIASGKHHGDTLNGTELKPHYEVLLTQLTSNSL